MMRPFTTFFTCVFIVFFAPVAALADGRLTVTGTGEVSAIPDIAVLRIGVLAQDPTAEAAMQIVATQAASLLEGFEALGVAARDIQTSQVSLNPRYANRTSNSGPDIVGFEARNTLTVTLRDLNTVGTVVTRALKDGANTLDRLSFDLSDPATALAEARRAAVADAMAKAKLFAEAAGLTLGPVESLTEGGAVVVPMPEMAMAAARMSDLPIAAGETALSATVTMVFSLSSD